MNDLIRGLGHDGEYELQYADGVPVMEHDVVSSERGVDYRVVHGRAPHKPGSTGRVFVSKGPGQAEYVPTVLNMRWVKL